MMTQATNSTAVPRRFRFRSRTARWMAVAVAAILVGAAVLFFSIARWNAQARLTSLRFRNVILNMRGASGQPVGYDGRAGGAMRDIISENGVRLLSWRVWLTEHSLPIPPSEWADYNKSWDDPRNLRTAKNGRYDFTRGADDPATTILAITGRGTVFDNDTPTPLEKAPGSAIVLVEVRNSGIHWMSPNDFDLLAIPHTINDQNGHGISGETPLGFHVAFADGEVWRLSHGTPFEKLSQFFLAEDAKRLNRDELLSEYRLAQTRCHPTCELATK